MMSALSMIKYSHRKKNQFFKKSTALLVAGALLCSMILPPYAFTYQRSCISFVEEKSAENHNMRERSNLFGDPKEARRVLLHETLPHRKSEIVSNIMDELFVAPWREYIETFDPIKFFKSHQEQTVGQAIGIIFIWVAMAVTMLGAPFGADLLISGDPTAHLGLDIFGSMLGALSIFSGIHLNKLKQLKHNFTKVEKIFLSITYLSYFPNFLAHHFHNLLSNLTRPLGRWRLGSLTLPKTFPASEKEPTLTALIKSINLRREQEKKTEEKLKSEKEKAQIQEAREYQLKLIAEKFGHFDEQDPFYREIREIFDSLVNVLKENGR